MKELHLNDSKYFSWASAGFNDDNLGKVAIGGESFWVKDCIQDENGMWHGVIDNDLVCHDIHGLNYGDLVSFYTTDCRRTGRCE